jgi:uncharacterized Zn finger protein
VSSLGDFFGSSVIRELAGPGAFVRGVEYFEDGRVEPEAGGGLRLRATVRGSVPYQVELWVDDGEPAWSCACPAADDGSFCKHCVAVALLLDREPSGGDGVERPDPWAVADQPGDDDDLAGYVAGLPHQRLVELVLGQAASDRRLRERLAAEASAARGDALDLGPWRKRIDLAFAGNNGPRGYRRAADWERDMDEVVDALEDLCDAGHADAVVGLAEHAHRRADEALDHLDDSDGRMDGISRRLRDVHLRACAAGSPEPDALARRLADLELSTELEGFRRAAAIYAEVLTAAGLAEYRRIVAPRWAKLAGADDIGGWSTERSRLREAMIGVALAGGDPDEMIAVRRRDLRSADDYIEIARALDAAGRSDEALAWARRGLDAHRSSARTSALRDLTTELLRRRSDRAGAVGLFWDDFDRSPSVRTYRRLLDESGGDAPAWRRRSLDTLRSRVADLTPQDRTVGSWRTSSPATALVEILAYEGDVDGAWEVATDHGCRDEMWLTLARARESTHPLDAAAVYEREVFAQIDRKDNDAYRRAVELMGRIRRLTAAAGEPERFQKLVARVRSEHGNKRNLKALLGGQRW